MHKFQFVFLVLVLSPLALRGQVAYDFQPFGALEASGASFHITHDEEGRLLVMGNFNLAIEGQVYSQMIRLSVAGAVDPTFRLYSDAQQQFSAVHGAQPDGQGGYWIFGQAEQTSNPQVFAPMPIAHIDGQGNRLEDFQPPLINYPSDFHIERVLPTANGPLAMVSGSARDTANNFMQFNYALTQFSGDGSVLTTRANPYNWPSSFERVQAKYTPYNTMLPTSDGRLLVANQGAYLVDTTTWAIESLFETGVQGAVPTAEGFWLYGYGLWSGNENYWHVAHVYPDGTLDTAYRVEQDSLPWVQSMVAYPSGRMVGLGSGAQGNLELFALFDDGNEDPFFTQPDLTSLHGRGSQVTALSTGEIFVMGQASTPRVGNKLLGFDALGAVLPDPPAPLTLVGPTIPSGYYAFPSGTYLTGRIDKAQGQETPNTSLVKFTAQREVEPSFAPPFEGRTLRRMSTMGPHRLLLTLSDSEGWSYLVVDADSGEPDTTIALPSLDPANLVVQGGWLGGSFVATETELALVNAEGEPYAAIQDTIATLLGATWRILGAKASPKHQYLHIAAIDVRTQRWIFSIDSVGNLTQTLLGRPSQNVLSFSYHPLTETSAWLFGSTAAYARDTLQIAYGLYDFEQQAFLWYTEISTEEHPAPRLGLPMVAVDSQGVVYLDEDLRTVVYFDRRYGHNPLFQLEKPQGRGVLFREGATPGFWMLGDFLSVQDTLTYGIFGAQFTPLVVTGWEVEESIPQFEVYPNPTEGDVHLRLPPGARGPITITLTDASGRIRLQQTRVISERVTLQPQLPAGLYFITVTSGQGASTRPLLIKDR